MVRVVTLSSSCTRRGEGGKRGRSAGTSATGRRPRGKGKSSRNGGGTKIGQKREREPREGIRTPRREEDRRQGRRYPGEDLCVMFGPAKTEGGGGKSYTKIVGAPKNQKKKQKRGEMKARELRNLRKPRRSIGKRVRRRTHGQPKAETKYGSTVINLCPIPRGVGEGKEGTAHLGIALRSRARVKGVGE